MAIREHLNHARTALDLGDRAGALSAVNAALAVDPEYLAAQALKEQIERTPDVPRSSNLRNEPGGAASPQKGAVASDQRPAVPPQPPVVSAEGWARFEHRARNRRIEHRVAAARLDINRRRFAEARAILREIGELDSGHPDLISLGMELDAEEHLAQSRRRRWGPAVAALLIFSAVIAGARYLQSPEWTSDVPVAVQSAAEMPHDGSPAAVGAAPATDAALTPAAPTGPASPAPSDAATPPETGLSVQPPLNTAPRPEEAPASVPQAPPSPPKATDAVDGLDRRPVEPAPAALPRDAEPTPRNAASTPTSGVPTPATGVPTPTSGRIEWPGLQPAVSPPAQPQPSFTPPPPAPAPAVTAAALPGNVAPELSPAVSPAVAPRDPDADRASSAAAAVINAPRDEDLVRRTLQQYRAAYESLDARSAQAVWPRVDEPALERAFSGLESQRLTFDDCDVRVRGTTGLATCRGTMLYVPKVGSRDPRREPRVWTFDLRKVGENWQIDNARTAR